MLRLTFSDAGTEALEVMAGTLMMEPSFSFCARFGSWLGFALVASPPAICTAVHPRLPGGTK